MKHILAFAATCSLLVGGCTSSTDTDATAQPVDVTTDSITLKTESPTGFDGLGRAALDTLMWINRDDGFVPGDGIGLDDVTSRIERTLKTLSDVPHVTLCRQNLGTGEVSVTTEDGNTVTTRAKWLCNIDWPDSSFDPNRHIRRWIHANVVSALNYTFGELKDTVRIYRQPLDECETLLAHYAGQYGKAFKQAITARAETDAYFEARYAMVGNLALIARVRAVSDDWVTYYIACIGSEGMPFYGMVSINRFTGKTLAVSDVAADKAAFDEKLQVALDEARSRQGEPQLVIRKDTYYDLGMTPDHLVVSVSPYQGGSESENAGTSVFFKLQEP